MRSATVSVPTGVAELSRGVCSESDCNRETEARGLCSMHYARAKYQGAFSKCSVDGCDRGVIGRGLCGGHLARLRRGKALGGALRHQKPVGGCVKDGYRLLYRPDHPHAQVNGQIPEHRLVMEQKIGRELLPHENVHHINGDRLDNRPENLELWSKSQPAGQRVDDKLAWAQSLLNTYSSFDCEKALAGELDAASGW